MTGVQTCALPIYFIIADIGGIAVTENEGNALMTMAFPKVHIVVVGIEKMLPYMKDLDLFWSLLDRKSVV